MRTRTATVNYPAAAIAYKDAAVWFHGKFSNFGDGE